MIETSTGEKFYAKKLILASGVKDIMPDIPGFAECWEFLLFIAIYCHGYEVKNEITGILSNGDMAYEVFKTDFNLTKKSHFIYQWKSCS